MTTSPHKKPTPPPKPPPPPPPPLVHLGLVESLLLRNNDRDQQEEEEEDNNNTWEFQSTDWSAQRRQAWYDRFCLLGHRQVNFENWDGGQVGGHPSWLNPQHLPTKPMYCLDCPTKMMRQMRRNDNKNDKQKKQQQQEEEEQEEPPMMRFIAQIYAPIDEREDAAFHRTIYIFACPRCVHRGSTDWTHRRGVRILRAQLPQRNPYFPPFGVDDDDDNAVANSAEADLAKWKNHLPSSYGIHLCRVSGMRGPYHCPLQKQYFANRRLQKEYKKHVFDVLKQQQQQQDGNNNENDDVDDDAITRAVRQYVDEHALLPSVYPLGELSVQEDDDAAAAAAGWKDIDDDDDDDDDDNDNNVDKIIPKISSFPKTLFPSSANSNNDDDDDDANLEQADLNRMLTGGDARPVVETDAVTAHFQAKIKSCPQQVLRYARWTDDDDDDEASSPLWLRAEGRPPTDQPTPPPCRYCGAPVRFECQLMPQLLPWLLQKKLRCHHGSAAKQREQDAEYCRIRQAIQTADDLIRQAPPEQIPPQLVESKQQAVANLRQYLLQEGGGGGGEGSQQQHALDWGAVAIYTCTQSCGTLSDPLDAALGAYREEVAWVQPSLDVQL